MEILLTNDDGVYTPAIAKLKQTINDLGNITVVAPDVEQSGASHSITFNRPLMVRKVFIDNDFFGYGVSGSPADSVKLAVRELMKKSPDLLISGINMGANLGIHVLHSGTVAAAIEGAILGVPSMAVSLEYSENPDIENAALFTRTMIDCLVKHDLPKGTLLNINIPAISWGSIKGIKVTSQYTLGLGERFDKHTDPKGQTFYWLTTDEGKPTSFAQGTDIEAIKDGYISITPLRFDLTNHNMLNELETMVKSLNE
ncbi:MAG: 5'/3'-nucleotidase SurE [Candidatus Anammoxibacter sp.]